MMYQVQSVAKALIGSSSGLSAISPIMSTSDVRSIESLVHLRGTLLALSSDWADSLHQIKYAARRIQERFGVEIPGYWKHQVELGERALGESLDNLSRLQSGKPGMSAGDTEARLRVAKARHRLAYCQAKQRRSKQLALAVEQACQDLAGPIAEVGVHSDANLPAAAADLARMIEHLSRYAEISTQATGQSSPTVPIDDPSVSQSKGTAG
jgi:hypothetical protein